MQKAPLSQTSIPSELGILDANAAQGRERRGVGVGAANEAEEKEEKENGEEEEEEEEWGVVFRMTCL